VVTARQAPVQFDKPAVQFSTIVMGDVAASWTGMIIRNRWPSGETSYGYELVESGPILP
jgi:hypothetical protein